MCHFTSLLTEHFDYHFSGYANNKKKKKKIKQRCLCSLYRQKAYDEEK